MKKEVIKEDLEKLTEQDLQKAYDTIQRMLVDPDKFADLPIQDRKYLVRLEESLRERLGKTKCLKTD